MSVKSLRIEKVIEKWLKWIGMACGEENPVEEKAETIPMIAY